MGSGPHFFEAVEPVHSARSFDRSGAPDYNLAELGRFLGFPLTVDLIIARLLPTPSINSALIAAMVPP